MKYTFSHWLLLTPIWLFVRISAFLLTPIAVIFFSSPDKKHLVFPFTWMETLDWDLCGDRHWRSSRMPFLGESCEYLLNRMAWVYRNGANTFNISVLGASEFSNAWRYSEQISLWNGYYLDPLFGWAKTPLGPERKRNFKLQCRIRRIENGN